MVAGDRDPGKLDMVPVTALTWRCCSLPEQELLGVTPADDGHYSGGGGVQVVQGSPDQMDAVRRARSD